VPGALIEVDYEHSWSWLAANGKKRNAVGGRRFWMRTNEKGIATAGVGRGRLKFSVREDDRAAETEVSVQDETPIEVVLHLK
jgi:hypothetical protein